MRKASDIPKTKESLWSKIIGQSITRIILDAGKGIGQNNRKFPPYTASYAAKKAKGFKNTQVSFTAQGKGVNFTAKRRPKNLRGLALNKRVSPPNLKLTGQMLGGINKGKVTKDGGEIVYLFGTRVQGNIDNKRSRDIFGLNNKNLQKVADSLGLQFEKNINKYVKEDIVYKIG